MRINKYCMARNSYSSVSRPKISGFDVTISRVNGARENINDNKMIFTIELKKIAKVCKRDECHMSGKPQLRKNLKVG